MVADHVTFQGCIRTASALLALLALVATPAHAQEDDFAKSVYEEIGNGVRNEYDGMIGEMRRNSMAHPPQDEEEQAKRDEQIKRETARLKSFAYNKAALFAFCAADADRARGPGAPPVRGEQNLVLRTCVELKFDQMRKFANISSYGALFFPERIAPCGERARLPEREKLLPPYEFLHIDDPKLYDYERFADCIMTPP
jgi:hypothetical protein